MFDINMLAVLVAVVVAFVLSGGYYAVLGSRLARLSAAYAEPHQRPAAATLVVELVRNVVVVVGVAALAGGLALAGLGSALLFALGLWVIFPVVLLAGSIFHERVPGQLAAIHAGDWLIKLVAISVIVALWP